MQPQPLPLKPLGEYANKRRREMSFEWKGENQVQWNWLQSKGLASEFEHWATSRAWLLGQWEYLSSIRRGVSEWARPTAEELVSRQPPTAKLHVTRDMVKAWTARVQSRGNHSSEKTTFTKPQDPAPEPETADQAIEF